jgi:Rrf2 family protein
VYPDIRFDGVIAMISQTAEYALRAVVLLGSSTGPLTTRQIAEQAQVPSGYLSKVLQALGRAGVVQAQRGLHGGFVLAGSLDHLSILDVLNAVDPLVRIDRCPLGLAEHRSRLCALHRRLDEGIAQVEALFGSTTIAQLLGENQSRNPLCEAAGATARSSSGRSRSSARK